MTLQWVILALSEAQPAIEENLFQPLTKLPTFICTCTHFFFFLFFFNWEAEENRIANLQEEVEEGGGQTWHWKISEYLPFFSEFHFQIWFHLFSLFTHFVFVFCLFFLSTYLLHSRSHGAYSARTWSAIDARFKISLFSRKFWWT